MFRVPNKPIGRILGRFLSKLRGSNVNVAPKQAEVDSVKRDTHRFPFPVAAGEAISRYGIWASAVTLHLRQPDGTESMICNGNLDTPDRVLTAAHGVFNRRSGQPLPKDRLFVRLANGAELPVGSVMFPSDLSYDEDGRPQFSLDLTYLKFDAPYFEASLEHDLKDVVDPSEASKYVNEYASIAVELGDLETARSLFMRNTQFNPRDAVAWNALGFISSRQNKFQDAIAHFTQAISIEPYDVAMSYFNRGDTHVAVGDYQQAVADFSVSLDQGFPMRSMALFARAKSWLKMGKSAEADRDLLEIIAAPPNENIDYTTRSRAFEALNRLPDGTLEMEQLLARDLDGPERKEALARWNYLLEAIHHGGNAVDAEQLFQHYRKRLTEILAGSPGQISDEDSLFLRRSYRVFLSGKKPAEAVQAALRISEKEMAEQKTERAETVVCAALSVAKESNQHSLIVSACLQAALVYAAKGDMTALFDQVSDIQAHIGDASAILALKDGSSKLRELVIRLWKIQEQSDGVDAERVSISELDEKLRNILYPTMELARLSGNIGGEGLAAYLLGTMAERNGELGEAERLFDTAIQYLGSSDEKLGLASAHFGMSLVAEGKGDQPRACSEMRAALSILQELNMPQQADSMTKFLKQTGCTSPA